MPQDTFGDRLKTEREDRGLSIDGVAENLGVDREHLLALERNDFESLPGEAEMLACLHGYAECLDVDAELMIEDYVGERDRAQARPAEPSAVAVPTESLTEVQSHRRAGARPPTPLGLVAMVIVAVALSAGWFFFSGDEDLPTSDDARVAELANSRVLSSTTSDDPVAQPATPQPAEPQLVAPDPVAVAPPPPAAAPVEPPPTRPTGRLKITEHGVGSAVENRQLTGRADRFAVGSQVYFWTHVVGASPGERIDHVWLMQGVEVMRIPLRIGGPNWRTHSVTALRAGGDWAVEARDSAGKVLARSEFSGVS